MPFALPHVAVLCDATPPAEFPLWNEVGISTLVKTFDAVSDVYSLGRVLLMIEPTLAWLQGHLTGPASPRQELVLVARAPSRDLLVAAINRFHLLGVFSQPLDAGIGTLLRAHFVQQQIRQQQINCGIDRDT